jgi:hypothetical protein
MEAKNKVNDKLRPRPLKVGEIVVFRLLNAGRIDPATNEPAFNSGATFEGISTIYCPFDKTPTSIKNIVGETIVTDNNGDQKVREVIGQVEFDGHGKIFINHTQPETYLFLSRDNRCATNPYRDKGVTPVWEEVIPVNIKKETQFLIDIEFDALKMVKSLDTKGVLALAEKLSESRLIEVNLSGNIRDVRYEVEKFCKVNPSEVIKAGKDSMSKIKLHIQDAINAREIEFVPELNEWIWSNKTGEAKKILEVKPGYDEVETLADYLHKEEEKQKDLTADKRTTTLLKRIIKATKELPV